MNNNTFKPYSITCFANSTSFRLPKHVRIRRRDGSEERWDANEWIPAQPGETATIIYEYDHPKPKLVVDNTKLKMI